MSPLYFAQHVTRIAVSREGLSPGRPASASRREGLSLGRPASASQLQFAGSRYTCPLWLQVAGSS